jgi:hypothetical protein
MIEVPSIKNPGSWDLITQPQKMIDNLISCNNVHFGQASQTPFAVSPLLDIFQGLQNTLITY